MLALALAIAASTCWGVADFLGGLRSRSAPALVIAAASQAVGVAFLISAVSVAGLDWFPGESALVVLVAGVTGAIGITAFYRALACGTMSIVAPVTATGVVIPVLLGIASGERPAGLQLLGVAVAALGVPLATRSQRGGGERRIAARESVVLALVAAACIGIGLTAYDRAAGSGPLTVVLWSRMVTLVLLGAALMRTGNASALQRGDLLPIALVGLLDVTAVTLYTTATLTGPLSVVAMAASVYPIVTILIAYTVLGERLRALQAVGVALALAGVSLLATG